MKYLEVITGHPFPAKLEEHGWYYLVNSKNKPMVGRDYASFKLAGKELGGGVCSPRSTAEFQKYQIIGT